MAGVDRWTIRNTGPSSRSQSPLTSRSPIVNKATPPMRATQSRGARSEYSNMNAPKTKTNAARDALARRHPQPSADRTGSEAEQQCEDDGESEGEQEHRHDVTPSLRGTPAGHECEVAGDQRQDARRCERDDPPAPNVRAGPTKPAP
jgi:hypothetical protein